MKLHVFSLLLLMPAAWADTGAGPPACDASAELQGLFAWVQDGGPPPAPQGDARPIGPPPPVWPLLEFVYDADGNGTLDQGEEEAMLADFTARCEALPDRRVDQPPPPPPPPPRDAGNPPPPVPPPLMERFDTNRDGRLSASEAAALRDSVRQSIRDAAPPPPPPPPR